MIEMDLERKTFEELLPFYVNGTLSADDIKFMRNYLISYPELQAQVKFSEALRSAVKDEATQYASDAGWDKLLKKYQAFHQKPTLSQRLKILSHNWGLTPAFGLAFSLLIAQSAIMFELGLFAPSSAYRELSTQAAIVPHLKITINPATDYAQLVDLFRKNGCRVVSGPSETGELWIHLEEPEKLLTIKADLLNSDLVDEVLSTASGSDK